MMSVRKIMTTQVVTVELDDKLSMVREIFESLKFHHVLAVESNKLFGVVSDRDLLKALSPNIGTAAETFKDTATLNKKVHQIMTRKPITLPPDASINEAIQLFITHNISCIPIVDGAFKPIGIVSWRDILKAIAARNS